MAGNAHDWLRPVYYRTTGPNIDSKTVVLVDQLRVSIGEPFCGECGTDYPGESKVCNPVAVDPLDAVIASAAKAFREPIIPAKRVNSRIDKRGGAA